MPASLRQILGGENLTGVIQSVKSGIPDVLPPAFMRTRRTVEGNTATYFRVKGIRETARQTAYGAPSRQRGQQELVEVPVTLIHVLESMYHQPWVLQNLQAVGSEAKQKLGRQEIARQTAEFKRLLTNTRLAAIYSMLAKGAIYFDGDGNLLPSSSGAAITVDYGVPSGNKDQIDDWDTATTDIIGAINDLKKTCVQKTGYPLRHAFYGESILGLFLANTYVKELINNNPSMAEAAYGRGEIPDGFCGLRWWPVYQSFYVDKDGNVQTFFGANQVVFTPEINADVYELLEGTYPVPTDIGRVASDAQAALGQVRMVSGQFSYAIVTADPVTIKQVAGDTFLPVWKNPDAIFIESDVTSS